MSRSPDAGTNHLDDFAEEVTVEPLSEEDSITAFAAEQEAVEPRRRTRGRAVALLLGGTAAMVAAVFFAAAYLHPDTPPSLDEQLVAAGIVAPPAADAPAAVPAQDAAGRAEPRPAPEVARRNSVPPPPVAVPTFGAAQASDSSTPLSGDWIMTTRVESSRLKRYEGLRLGYRVELHQDGNRIRGNGWKVTEDHRRIGVNGRTPITLDGTVTGDRIELTFTEGGKIRQTAGKLILARHSEDEMVGRFSSTAAQSNGIVEIHR